MKERDSKRPTAVDLFVGAGGLSLGLEKAGFDIVAAVEIDPIHAATHERNFPRTAVVCKDIRKVTGAEIKTAAGLGDRAPDAVVGGPPCQGFSLIGHRVLEDPRNSLVFHFLRLVFELRPKVFVMENVPGMATGRHTQLLDELIRNFGRGGYVVRLPYQTLNAANFGVPQDRERLFLIGALSGQKLPEYPEFRTILPSSRSRNGSRDLFSKLGLPECPKVIDALGDLPDIEAHSSLFQNDEIPAKYSEGSDFSLVLRGEADDPEDLSYPRVNPVGTLSGCGRARHTEKSKKRFRETEGGSTEPVSRFYKLDLYGVSNTLRAGTASDRGAFSAPRPIHPLKPRCITVREAARLHSFPDWFQFHQTVWHGFRQIGNSVPPFLGRAVGIELVKALGAAPKRPKETFTLGPPELSGFNMRQAAEHFGVDPGVIPKRRRGAGKDGTHDGGQKQVQIDNRSRLQESLPPRR